jgi:Tol biopolymer transport system component
MKRLAIVVVSMLAASACTPSPLSPSPSPPDDRIACNTGASATAMFLMGAGPAAVHLLDLPLSPEVLYDVSDPIHPRWLCRIANTSAHLLTGDTFVYLKPVSATETDIMLHSLGSGKESIAGRFPFIVSAGAWSPDGSLMAYMVAPQPDNTHVQVWLYSQGRTSLLYTYAIGIGDCICRFGLPPAVLAFSPDGEYLVAGRLSGKGSSPLAVLRVSDGAQVLTADPDIDQAIWDRTGHRMFLVHFGNRGVDSWSPGTRVVRITGNSWMHLPGLSPDGTKVAYTADPSDVVTELQPRVYVFDLKTASTRMLVDQLRTQVLFIKDGWVWYLEERACVSADGCTGGTTPTGKVFAMDLSKGIEQVVTFAPGSDPLTQAGRYELRFVPGEVWPAA